MSYTVVWLPAVERRLAELWNAAADRQSIANAADRIDAVLRRSPLAVGKSRERGIRTLLQKPTRGGRTYLAVSLGALL